MTPMQTTSPPATTTPRPPGAPRLPRPAAAPARPQTSVSTVDPMRVLRQYFWWIALSVVVGAGLGVVAHLIWAWTYPIFAATTVWEINLPKRDLADVTTGAVTTTGEQLDRTIGTVAANMIGTPVLRPAIASPEVRRTKWIQEFTDPSGNIQIDNALSDLQDRIRPRIDNTLQVALKITGPRKDDLVILLSAINKEYEGLLNRQKENNKIDTVLPFTKERDALTRKIESLAGEISTRIQNENINLDVKNSDEAMALALIRESINQRQSDLSIVLASLSASDERVKEPSLTFSPDEMAAARENPKILGLEDDILQLRTSLRDARSHFGASHLYVRNLEDKLAAAETELDTELQTVMRNNFMAQRETAKNNARSIRQILAQLEQDRAAAAARVNDLLKAVEWVNNKQAELVKAQEQLALVNQNISQASMMSQMQSTLRATLVQPPEALPLPEHPKIYFMIPLGVLLVAGLTTGGIFLRELTDRRVKGPSCVGTLPHGKVLGVVPHLDEDPGHPRRVELVQVDSPRSVLAESIRHVFAPLSRKMNESALHSLLIVGGQPGAGCTALISNIAACFAGSERRVLVIDGNFRRPRIAEVFGVAASPGLGDVLNGAATFEQAVQDSRVEKVSVLTAGSESSRHVDLLTTPRFGRIMTEARQKYDFILVDAPAAVVSGDWQTLANHVDASVLVVRCMQEERGLVARLIGQLRDARPEHIGVILNAARSEAGGYLKRNLKQMDQYQRADR